MHKGDTNKKVEGGGAATYLEVRPRGFKSRFILLWIELGARGVTGRRQGAEDVGLDHTHDLWVDGFCYGRRWAVTAVSATASGCRCAISAALKDVFNHFGEDVAFHLLALQV